MGASDFPRLLWMWPLPTFIGKWKKKQNQKEFPSCFIPCLLVVFTHKRELSIIGISLLLLKDFHVLWVMYYSKQKDWTLNVSNVCYRGIKTIGNFKIIGHRKKSLWLLMRGDHSREIPAVVIQLGKFWWFFFFCFLLK